MNINVWDVVLLCNSTYRIITNIDVLTWYSIDKEWNTIWWTKGFSWIDLNKYDLFDNERTFCTEFIYLSEIDFVIPSKFISMFKIKNFII